MSIKKELKTLDSLIEKSKSLNESGDLDNFIRFLQEKRERVAMKIGIKKCYPKI